MRILLLILLQTIFISTPILFRNALVNSIEALKFNLMPEKAIFIINRRCKVEPNRWAKSESYLTFEKEIKLITNDNTTMGIEELILDMAKKEGLEKGVNDTLEAVVTNLIVKLGLTNEQAADVAGVTPEFVAEIRENLGR